MITEFEIGILLWVQAHLQCTLLTGIATVLSYIGEAGIVWIVITLFMLIRKDTRRVGVAMAIALLLDLLFCNVLIKPLVARVRPYYQCTDLLPPVYLPTEYSFPSGHTASAFAAAGAMVFEKGRGRWAAILFSVIMGLSRIYLTVHFPTDVICAVPLGLFCAFLGHLAAKLLAKRLHFAE